MCKVKVNTTWVVAGAGAVRRDSAALAEKDRPVQSLEPP